jgi:thiol-disulfide isomerase/thioredoxin
MKFNNYLLLLLLLFFVSCVETNVIYSDILIDDTVDAPPVSGQFTKHVLIEDFTGTWCGNCTRVSYSISKVMEQTNKAVAVAIHNGNDPYNFDGIEPLRNQIYPNTTDFPLPTSRLNRTITWVFPEDSNIQQVKNLTSSNCGLGLAMNSTIANGIISLDVKLKLAQNYSNVRLVVYLLENHLIYDQRNYTNFYGSSNVPDYVDFEHNHVLRNTLTAILGDPITEETLFGKTIVKRFSLPVPVVISNPENISFVAFVVDENNTVVNCRDSEVSQNQTFEENP